MGEDNQLVNAQALPREGTAHLCSGTGKVAYPSRYRGPDSQARIGYSRMQVTLPATVTVLSSLCFLRLFGDSFL